MNKLPIYKIVLGDADGIRKMSLVKLPAVEVDFLKFEKLEEIKFSFDADQHIVFGCALRADYPIYRFSPTLGSYFVVFDKETIKQLYEKFMTDGRSNAVNLNHSVDTDGVYLIQSFLKDINRGINPAGFDDVADGSWFCSYKITNEDVWEEVKNGTFNGFSVEGMFYTEEALEEMDEIDKLIDEILN